MSREELRDLQGKRLHKLVDLVYHNTPFYRAKMQEMDLLPDDIRTIDDIVKLPFTTKADLRDNYPVGLLATPMSEIVRIHASSGTTGNPTIVGYTYRDLEIWKEVIARALTAYGVTRGDIVSVGYGYGLFTGGLGAHYGVEHLGATVLPTSTGNTEKHIRLLRDLGVTGIACTPSYALYLAEALHKQGLSADDLKLRIGAFGAEPWTENMRREIEERLGIQAYNIYGLSEIMGPGVAYECGCKNGSHIAEDHFYPEIIHPETGEVLPLGQEGELVLTTLTYERPDDIDARHVRMRTYQCALYAYPRTERRYADHTRHQRVPLTGGKRDSGDAGICATLHVGGRPQKQHGYVGGAGGVASG